MMETSIQNRKQFILIVSMNQLCCFIKTCLNCPSFRRLFVGVRDNKVFFSGDRGGSATKRWSSELPEAQTWCYATPSPRAYAAGDKSVFERATSGDGRPSARACAPRQSKTKSPLGLLVRRPRGAKLAGFLKKSTRLRE